jgi:hypothetical protein
MNRIFNWHALGVPLNQMNCFLKDGTIEDFVKATFDPVPSMTTLKVCLCLSCLTTAFCLLPLPLHFFLHSVLLIRVSKVVFCQKEDESLFEEKRRVLAGSNSVRSSSPMLNSRTTITSTTSVSAVNTLALHAHHISNQKVSGL